MARFNSLEIRNTTTLHARKPNMIPTEVQQPSASGQLQDQHFFCSSCKLTGEQRIHFFAWSASWENGSYNGLFLFNLLNGLISFGTKSAKPEMKPWHRYTNVAIRLQPPCRSHLHTDENKGGGEGNNTLAREKYEKGQLKTKKNWRRGWNQLTDPM